MFDRLLCVVRDRPDILVIDIGALGAVDVAHANNIPYVINNPSLLFRIDNNPHYVPGTMTRNKSNGASDLYDVASTVFVIAWGSGFTQQMTLWERCLSVLYPRLLAGMIHHTDLCDQRVSTDSCVTIHSCVNPNVYGSE